MKISFVIPAFNEEKLIGRALDSIREAGGAFAKRAWGQEWIVCDNNSTDATAEIAGAAGAKVVFEPINQIARARNRGASAASGDWIIFVDADSCPSRGLLEEVAEAIASGSVIGGGAVVKMDRHHWAGTPLTRCWNQLSQWAQWMAGSFIFCESSAFRELGGFSHELFVSEEIDFSRRLKSLARQRRKRIVILTRHPLLTSARKMDLYSAAEYFRFMVRAVLRPGRTTRTRDSCGIWYDGRR